VNREQTEARVRDLKQYFRQQADEFPDGDFPEEVQREWSINANELREREAWIADHDAKLERILALGQAGFTEHGDGAGGSRNDRGNRYSARRDDPKHIAVLGPNDSFVDYLRDTGEVVYDQEFRLSMLGALGSGNKRALNRLAKYATGETRDMLISSGGNAVLTPDAVSAELIDRLRANTVC
jgi:hypothetical protein